ncbi:unnamed protein product [Cutaneotrichosporon oleaginosum]
MQGSCLCRGITLRIAQPPSVHVCRTLSPLPVTHADCTDCRQFTGAIAAFLLPVPRDHVSVTGYPSGYASASDTGARVTRYFCGNCGSSLYDRGEDPDMIYVHGGLFPPRTLPKPSKEIFVRSAEAWTSRYPGCRVSETEVKAGEGE